MISNFFVKFVMRDFILVHKNNVYLEQLIIVKFIEHLLGSVKNVSMVFISMKVINVFLILSRILSHVKVFQIKLITFVKIVILMK